SMGEVMTRSLLARIPVAALLVVTLPAQADLLSNLNPIADTALFETNPGNNLGGITDFPSGGTAAVLNTNIAQRSRALIKFDLSGIPANAAINSVALTIVEVKEPLSSPVASTYALNRALRDWGEGNKTGSIGSPATAGEATWTNRFFPNISWGAPGGAAGI